MENHPDQNQDDRIALMKTINESAVGRNLLEAVQNLFSSQTSRFDGVSRLEILSARRASTFFFMRVPGKGGELFELWEFEIFTHADGL
jgi:hypothetical protein